MPRLRWQSTMPAKMMLFSLRERGMRERRFHGREQLPSMTAKSLAEALRELGYDCSRQVAEKTA